MSCWNGVVEWLISLVWCHTMTPSHTLSLAFRHPSSKLCRELVTSFFRNWLRRFAVIGYVVEGTGGSVPPSGAVTTELSPRLSASSSKPWLSTKRDLWRNQLDLWKENKTEHYSLLVLWQRGRETETETNRQTNKQKAKHKQTKFKNKNNKKQQQQQQQQTITEHRANTNRTLLPKAENKNRTV